MIEKFQQECLSLVLRVPFTVPRNELNQIMGEKSIIEKCAVTASRLSSYCPRNMQRLKWKDGVIPTSRRTRGKQELRPGWTGADKNDIGDRMHVLTEEYRGTINEIVRCEFDVPAATLWGRAQSLRISNHIKAQKAAKAAKEATTNQAGI